MVCTGQVAVWLQPQPKAKNLPVATFEVGMQMLGKAYRDLRDFTVSLKICSAPGTLFWPWAHPCCFFNAAALDGSGGGAVDYAAGAPASPSQVHQSDGCCRNMTRRSAQLHDW